MTWGEHHTQSERLAHDAELAFGRGDAESAGRLYLEAAEAETRALADVGPGKLRTLGITAVSAVALWYKGRAYQEAERLAHRVLASEQLPEFAMRQLQSLLQMIWSAAGAQTAGLRFVPGDLLISIKGGLVIHGGAPLDLIVQRVEGIQAVLFRVVELLMGRPLRRRGGPALEVQSLIRPWLFHAPAGSYQFAVRVEEPKQFELFAPVDRPRPDQITSTFFSVLRASSSDDPERELATVVPDSGYREAFASLSRNLAPAGKTFERLEIRDASAPATPTVTLAESSRKDLNAVLRKLKPREPRDEAEPVEIRGILRGLHLDHDWLEIQPDSGTPIHVDGAGDVLDDVVGPMVNHRVLVTAVRRGTRHVYQDIELQE